MSILLASLAPLGATHKLSFIPEFDAAGNVSVAVVYSLKSDKDGSSIKTLNLTGTIAEVDAALVAELPAAIGKLVAHTASLKTLDDELAAELAAAKEKNAKAKPAKKDDEKKPDDNAVPEPKPEPPKRGKNRETKIIKTAPAATPPAPEPAAPAAPAPSGLVPAWKSATVVPAVAPPAEPAPAGDTPPDLGSLFGEQ